MSESVENSQSRAIEIQEAAKGYQNAKGDAREKLVNTSLVVVNELGIADPASFRAVRDIAVKETGTYMPDVITELHNDKLVAIGNAFFHSEDTPQQTLDDVAARIARLAAGERSSAVHAGKQTGDDESFKEDVFREMAERIRGEDLKESSDMLEAISKNATPEFVEEVLQEPELLASLIVHADEISNDVLRNIILRRAEEPDAPEDGRPGPAQVKTYPEETGEV